VGAGRAKVFWSIVGVSLGVAPCRVQAGCHARPNAHNA